MASNPTVSELRKAGTITSLEIVAAVDAYVQDPTAGPYRFASGHSLSIAAALEASANAAELMARPGPKAKAFRNAITTTIMTARPTPPGPVHRLDSVRGRASD